MVSYKTCTHRFRHCNCIEKSSISSSLMVPQGEYLKRKIAFASTSLRQETDCPSIRAFKIECSKRLHNLERLLQETGTRNAPWYRETNTTESRRTLRAALSR